MASPFSTLFPAAPALDTSSDGSPLTDLSGDPALKGLETADGRYVLDDADTLIDKRNGRELRLNGFDSAEKSSALGGEQTRRLKDVLDSYGPDGVGYTVTGIDEYGRDLVDLTDSNGYILNGMLVEQGLGRATNFEGDDVKRFDNEDVASYYYLKQNDPALLQAKADHINKMTRPENIPERRPKERSLSEEFGVGVDRGIDSLQAAGYGAVALAGSALGIDAVRDWGMGGYNDNVREAGKNAPSVTFKEMELGENFMQWAAGALGEAVPSMGSMIAGGGVTSLAARKLTERSIRKHLVDKASEALVAKGVSEKTALQWIEKSLASEATHNKLYKATMHGATAGVFGSSAIPQAGDVFAEIYDEVGVEAPATALAAGGLGGFLDAIGPTHILKKLFPGTDAKTAKGFIMRWFQLAPSQTIIEGTTEAAQEFIANVARAYEDPEFDPLSEEAFDEYKAAAATGALVGAVTGTIASPFTGGQTESGTDTGLVGPVDPRGRPAHGQGDKGFGALENAQIGGTEQTAAETASDVPPAFDEAPTFDEAGNVVDESVPPQSEEQTPGVVQKAKATATKAAKDVKETVLNPEVQEDAAKIIESAAAEGVSEVASPTPPEDGDKREEKKPWIDFVTLQPTVTPEGDVVAVSTDAALAANQNNLPLLTEAQLQKNLADRQRKVAAYIAHEQTRPAMDKEWRSLYSDQAIQNITQEMHMYEQALAKKTKQNLGATKQAVDALNATRTKLEQSQREKATPQPSQKPIVKPTKKSDPLDTALARVEEAMRTGVKPTRQDFTKAEWTALQKHKRAQAKKPQSERIKQKAQQRKAAQKQQPSKPKPVTNMKMYYRDGQVVGGRRLAMRPEFRGKSTLDLIKSGDRTATTRRTAAAFGKLKVGDVFTVEGAKGEKVAVRLTHAPEKVSSMTREEWSSREGWDTKEYDLYKDFYQARYELVNPAKQQPSKPKPVTKEPSVERQVVQAALEKGTKPATVLKMLRKQLSPEAYTALKGKAKELGLTLPKYVEHLRSQSKAEPKPEPEAVKTKTESAQEPSFNEAVSFGSRALSPGEFAFVLRHLGGERGELRSGSRTDILERGKVAGLIDDQNRLVVSKLSRKDRQDLRLALKNLPAEQNAYAALAESLIAQLKAQEKTTPKLRVVESKPKNPGAKTTVTLQGNKGPLVEVPGFIARNKNGPEIEFVVHRTPKRVAEDTYAHNPKGSWQVTEASTGMRVGGGGHPTRMAALEALNRLTPGQIAKIRETLAERAGTKPVETKAAKPKAEPKAKPKAKPKEQKLTSLKELGAAMSKQPERALPTEEEARVMARKSKALERAETQLRAVNEELRKQRRALGNAADKKAPPIIRKLRTQQDQLRTRIAKLQEEVGEYRAELNDPDMREIYNLTQGAVDDSAVGKEAKVDEEGNVVEERTNSLTIYTELEQQMADDEIASVWHGSGKTKGKEHALPFKTKKKAEIKIKALKREEFLDHVSILKGQGITDEQKLKDEAKARMDNTYEIHEVRGGYLIEERGIRDALRDLPHFTEEEIKDLMGFKNPETGKWVSYGSEYLVKNPDVLVEAKTETGSIVYFNVQDMTQLGIKKMPYRGTLTTRERLISGFTFAVTELATKPNQPFTFPELGIVEGGVMPDPEVMIDADDLILQKKKWEIKNAEREKLERWEQYWEDAPEAVMELQREKADDYRLKYVKAVKPVWTSRMTYDAARETIEREEGRIEELLAEIDDKLTADKSKLSTTDKAKVRKAFDKISELKASIRKQRIKQQGAMEKAVLDRTSNRSITLLESTGILTTAGTLEAKTGMSRYEDLGGKLVDYDTKSGVVENEESSKTQDDAEAKDVSKRTSDLDPKKPKVDKDKLPVLGSGDTRVESRGVPQVAADFVYDLAKRFGLKFRFTLVNEDTAGDMISTGATDIEALKARREKLVAKSKDALEAHKKAVAKTERLRKSANTAVREMNEARPSKFVKRSREALRMQGSKRETALEAIAEYRLKLDELNNEILTVGKENLNEIQAIDKAIKSAEKQNKKLKPRVRLTRDNEVVIFLPKRIRNSKDIIPALSHEVGHVVLQAFRANLKGPQLKRLEDMYNTHVPEQLRADYPIDEWFSNQVVGFIINSKKVRDGIDSIFKRAGRKLKEVWNYLRVKSQLDGHFKVVPEFEAWLKEMVAENRNLQAAMPINEFMEFTVPGTAAAKKAADKARRTQIGQLTSYSATKSAGIMATFAKNYVASVNYWFQNQKDINGDPIYAFQLLGNIIRHAPGAQIPDHMKAVQDNTKDHSKRTVVHESLENATQSEQGKRNQTINEVIEMVLARYPVKKYLSPKKWKQRQKLVSDDMNAIRKELLDEKPTSQLSPEARKIREMLDDMHGYLQDALPELEYRQNFFPWVWNTAYVQDNRGKLIDILMNPKNWKYAEDAFTDRDHAGNVVDRIISEGGLNTAMDVDETANPLFGVAGGFASGQHRMLGGLKPEVMHEFGEQDLVNILRTYAHSGIKRAEFSRRFGRYQKFRSGKTVFDKWVPDAVLQDLVAEGTSQMGRWTQDSVSGTKRWDSAPADMQKRVKTNIQAVRGQLGRDMPQDIRHAMGWLMTFMNYTVLSFATLASIPDLAGVMIRSKGDVRSAFKGYTEGMKSTFRRYATNKDDLWTLGESLGILTDEIHSAVLQEQYGMQYLSNSSKKANELFFKATLLHQFTLMTRAMGLGAAKGFIITAAKNAANGNKRDQRYLNELGLTAAEVQAWQQFGLNEDKVHKAMNQFVNEAVLRPTASQRPAYGSDPRFMLLFHLKSFAYTFWETIVKGVYNEVGARRGEGAGLTEQMIPVATAAFTLLPLAAAGLWIRDWITYGEEGHPKRRTSDDYLSMGYAKELATRTGLFGPGIQMYMDMEDAEGRGQLGIAGAIGPAPSRFMDLMTKEWDMALALRQIPGLSQMPRWRQHILETYGDDE